MQMYSIEIVYLVYLICFGYLICCCCCFRKISSFVKNVHWLS